MGTRVKKNRRKRRRGEVDPGLLKDLRYAAESIRKVESDPLALEELRNNEEAFAKYKVMKDGFTVENGFGIDAGARVYYDEKVDDDCKYCPVKQQYYKHYKSVDEMPDNPYEGVK